MSWFGSDDDDVGALINKKKYRKAVKVLRQQLDERPGNIHLRQRLADVLALAGDGGGALKILDKMVDEFAAEGFDAKAIAVLKKMQRIDPDCHGVEDKLIQLIKRRDGDQFQPAVPAPTSSAEELGTSTEVGLRLSAVQHSPLFTTFSSGELLAVIQGLNLHDFEAGEIIVSEDEPGDSLFVVAGGSVRVYVRNSAGNNKQVRILEEGEFFGEISLLSGKPRTATITAAGPTEILELGRRTLATLVIRHPQVPKVIQEVSASRAMSPEEIEARG